MEQIQAVLMPCLVVVGKILAAMMGQGNLAIGGLPLNQKQAKVGLEIWQPHTIWFIGVNFLTNLAFQSDVLKNSLIS
jgi:hypothetical protein